ncbi:hypothetical protein B0J12DRAFT_342169 [Macrophomina phaseolina]|uniref:Uncharacterized protein n=1 Tax=Macrophomina phaseolina TaxID=35725 RepID=A0ABQ8GQ50_9PEZI|nr:hypothetical protein B0J12DRAFT_342169 [Macrophomina phaseolina]
MAAGWRSRRREVGAGWLRSALRPAGATEGDVGEPPSATSRPEWQAGTCKNEGDGRAKERVRRDFGSGRCARVRQIAGEIERAGMAQRRSSSFVVRPARVPDVGADRVWRAAAGEGWAGGQTPQQAREQPACSGDILTLSAGRLRQGVSVGG